MFQARTRHPSRLGCPPQDLESLLCQMAVDGPAVRSEPDRVRRCRRHGRRGDALGRPGPAGPGRERGAGYRLDGRQGRSPRLRPPTCSKPGPTRCSKPTPDVAEAEAAGAATDGCRPAPPDRGPGGGHGPGPAPGGLACPIPWARPSPAGSGPTGSRSARSGFPLGVVGIIYENRPNVTSDAAALCLKSGNAAFLRGSSAALRSNQAIATVLREGYEKGRPSARRPPARRGHQPRVGPGVSCKLRGVIDCLIPRGGPSLIDVIIEHATVPYVIDGDGNCHVYVDRAADLDMALRIVVNAKTQRPSVCNAAESLVVHRDIASEFLARLDRRSRASSCAATRRPDPCWVGTGCPPATDDDYAREFLDLTMSVRVVDDLDEAIDHIRRYGSGHTEAIVTRDLAAAHRFQLEVDAAAVVVNASTRFTDGEEFGFGAEIGISTQKLHARGPMGLRALDHDQIPGDRDGSDQKLTQVGGLAGSGGADPE